MKILLIVNPTSGNRGAQRNLDRVAGWLTRHGHRVEVRFTRGPGDATVLARSEGPAYDAVVGAGGDGTLNEVLNGVVGLDVKLGLLPWGTGNVFAKEMGFPRRLKKLCRVLHRGRTVRMDVGRSGDRAFLLMAGAGLDAYALGRMEQAGWKRRWGLAAYGWGAFEALARYPAPPIQVVLDGVRTDRGTFVVVSNTKLYGAFFTIHPAADPTDGLLDVFVFRDGGRWNFLGFLAQMAFRAWWGRRGPLPASLDRRHGFHRARTVGLSAVHPVPFQVDGDPLGTLPRTIEVQPGAVEVIVPRKTARRLRTTSE